MSAIRLCADGSADLTGAFSPGVSFTTPAKTVETVSTSSGIIPNKGTENRQLSDQQWAMIILLGFALCAVLIAFLAQKIIHYTSGESRPMDGAPPSSENVGDTITNH